MTRRTSLTLTVLAAGALLPLTAVSLSATAAAPTPADDDSRVVGKHVRSNPLATQRTSLRREAVDQLVSGDAELVRRGPNRAIELDDGTLVDYPAEETAQLLTFLVEFGEGGAPADPEWPQEGPLHNDIPEPDETDNSTYWRADFNRKHYEDMLFDGLAEQGGESMRGLYNEMSSGRFDLQGDVSDWVQVDNPESHYSDDEGFEDQQAMTAFIGDSAEAWYDAQLDAGKTPEQIADYLKTFDVWDRYDADGDEDVTEPDGYIDHFQAVHAGIGEEAYGAPPWAIYSHRSAANIAGHGEVGPEADEECGACRPQGGVPIGETGLWIFDYTVEPEDGVLGVFAHEFGHDLGLPDYYDTNPDASTENGTGFWNLMGTGAWLSHGDGRGLGTTPNQMGATEKLFLGWYGENDLVTVDGVAEEAQEVTLGPSHHATTVGKQALLVNLPKVVREEDSPFFAEDASYLYSGARSDSAVTAVSPELTVSDETPVLAATVAYKIESGWDYAYLDVSTDDGGTWTTLETSLSTDDDPNGQNLGHGITGASPEDGNAEVELTADLSEYAGEEVRLRWRHVTDGNTTHKGLAVFSMGIAGTEVSDFDDWTLTGFNLVINGDYEFERTHYYVAENRQYAGYDSTLEDGPYNYTDNEAAPNEVAHFPYQDGLLVWYSNDFYTDNNTSVHPGGGANLPVDASPSNLVWEHDGESAALVRGRIQTYDSTFDVDQVSDLALENDFFGWELSAPAYPSTPVFDDFDYDGYLDDSGGSDGLAYSTEVGGVGAMIQVLSSDETTGQMVVRVGHRWVAATTMPTISGGTRPGQVLTAHAPTWWHWDVQQHHVWQRDGDPIEGTSDDSTYELQPEDAGHEVTVAYTGTAEGYTPHTVYGEEVSVRFAAPEATASPSIIGTAQVGATLTAEAGAWPVEGDASTVWKIGDVIVGDGPTYVVQPGDLGKVVTLEEQLTTDEYEPGIATETSTPVIKGAAPTAVVAPKITGTARVGSTLKATKGLWPRSGTSTFAWTVGGKSVGTGTTYAVKPADAGKRVVLTETFTSTGYQPGKATTQSAVVAKAPVTLAVTPGAAKPHKKVTVAIRATAPGGTVTGSVVVTYAGKALKPVKLVNGKATVTLPAKARGSYRLVVRYAATTAFAAAEKALTVRVR